MDMRSKLSELVGDKYVDDTSETLVGFSKDHSLMDVKGLPDVVVRPGSAEEVQRVVSFANEEKIPVIPVSSSVHFHGSTLAKMGGMILDMRRMNRILDIHLPERLARVEAGVTWGQLQSELSKHQQRMIMPLMPPASSSVVTSLLEREVSTNPRYELAEPLTSTEVVWGNGMLFRTGSASTPGFPEKSTCKGGNPYGPGTDFFRFLQGAEGTMGAVTWSIVKIEYLPEQDQVYFMGFNRLSDAIEPLYRIQRRLIGDECILINNQVGALIFAEEWADDYQRLRRDLPAWLLVVVLSGAQRFPEEKLAYQKEALEEVVSQIPAARQVMAFLPCAAGLEKRLPGMLRNPWPEDRVYWKHQLKGSCQDLFFITKMEKVPQLTKTVTDVASAHGYDPGDIGMYLQVIEQGRACHMEYQFYYDPENGDEIERVKALYMEAAGLLFKQGVFFSRPYGLLSPMVYENARGYANTLVKVKGVLDPNNIMCPGNVCF